MEYRDQVRRSSVSLGSDLHFNLEEALALERTWVQVTDHIETNPECTD
jgi:hypothetical protein